MIQFVGNTMTFAALRETSHHAGWVRRTVAALAGWNRFVLVLVAGYAKHSFMFGITAGKQLERFLMTGCTHFVRCIRSHKYRCRHMGLVAFFTFCGHHISAMRLVALGTLRDFAVNVVTEAASQVGMLALDLLQLDDLIGMAGQTFLGDIVCKLDNFRGMRIAMAPQTVGQLVVRLLRMTLATDRDNLFD